MKRYSSLNGVEGGKPEFEIGLQILDILQANMQTQGRSVGRPFSRCAVTSQSNGGIRPSNPPHE
jgi:hypothetical protein